MQNVKGDGVFVLLAPGFEETDVTMATSILRRSGHSVVLVGLAAGPIRGAHGLLLVPDRPLSEVVEHIPRALVLPGGARGAQRLGAEPRVHVLLHRVFARGGYVLALDASQKVLRHAGLPETRDWSPVSPRQAASTGPDLDRAATRVAAHGRVILGLSSDAVKESATELALLLASETGKLTLPWE